MAPALAARAIASRQLVFSGHCRGRIRFVQETCRSDRSCPITWIAAKYSLQESHADTDHGGTGFIGQALCPRLAAARARSDRPHPPVGASVASRRRDRGDPAGHSGCERFRRGDQPRRCRRSATRAGRRVASGCCSSRALGTTARVVEWMRRAAQPPACSFCSAVGYYGEQGDRRRRRGHATDTGVHPRISAQPGSARPTRRRRSACACAGFASASCWTRGVAHWRKCCPRSDSVRAGGWDPERTISLDPPRGHRGDLPVVARLAQSRHKRRSSRERWGRRWVGPRCSRCRSRPQAACSARCPSCCSSATGCCQRLLEIVFHYPVAGALEGDPRTSWAAPRASGAG